MYKQEAQKIVSYYFSKVVGTNYKHDRFFPNYENIAKEYAIIEVIKRFGNFSKSKDLIQEIRDL